MLEGDGLWSILASLLRCCHSSERHR